MAGLPPEPISQEALKEIDAQRREFARHYAAIGNADHSSILAGYDHSYGHVLLKDSRILAAIAYYRELLTERSAYDPEKLVWA